MLYLMRPQPPTEHRRVTPQPPSDSSQTYKVFRQFTRKLLHKARLRLILARTAYDIDTYLSSR